MSCLKLVVREVKSCLSIYSSGRGSSVRCKIDITATSRHPPSRKTLSQCQTDDIVQILSAGSLTSLFFPHVLTSQATAETAQPVVSNIVLQNPMNQDTTNGVTHSSLKSQPNSTLGRNNPSSFGGQNVFGSTADPDANHATRKGWSYNPLDKRK